MSMSTEQFRSLIQNKIFVEISDPTFSVTFTSLTEEGSSYRSIANEAGVIIFLSLINKIYARGIYYGISGTDWTGITTRLSSIEDELNSLQPPLQDLAALVQQNTQNIAGAATGISNLQTLIGATELANGASSVLSRLNMIEQEITLLSPTGSTGSMSDAIVEIVNQHLDNVLNDNIENYLTENNYMTLTGVQGYLSNNNYTTLTGVQGYLTENNYMTLTGVNSLIEDLDLGTVKTAIQRLDEQILLKASQHDFSALVELMGATGLSSVTWGTGITGSVVNVINTLNNTTQQLAASIDIIPKFDIQVVSANNNGEPDIAVNDISKTTIYLVPSDSDEIEAGTDVEDISTSRDMYTEYIYINRNAGKYDNQVPPQPLAPDYHWEKLGRQAFKMSQYLTEEQILQITNNLSGTLAGLADQIDNANLAQIEQNKTDIGNVQTSLSNIINRLSNIIGTTGALVLTGEDIRTTKSGTGTIAGDISNLYEQKLDKESISWVLISGATGVGE